MNPQVFREYDIRGVVEDDFDDDFVVNLGRGYLAATALIAIALYLLWRRAGRPSGVEQVERIAEADD